MIITRRWQEVEPEIVKWADSHYGRGVGGGALIGRGCGVVTPGGLASQQPIGSGYLFPPPKGTAHLLTTLATWNAPQQRQQRHLLEKHKHQIINYPHRRA